MTTAKNLAEELYGRIVLTLGEGSLLQLRQNEIEAAAEAAAKLIELRTVPAPIIQVARRVHSGDYPHEGGCLGCRRMKVCNICAEPWGHNHCTNGRCDRCHNAVCTPGGVTSPGHGFNARERIKEHYESVRGSTP